MVFKSVASSSSALRGHDVPPVQLQDGTHRHVQALHRRAAHLVHQRVHRGLVRRQQQHVAVAVRLGQVPDEFSKPLVHVLEAAVPRRDLVARDEGYVVRVDGKCRVELRGNRRDRSRVGLGVFV